MDEVGLVLLWAILVAYSPYSVQTMSTKGERFVLPTLLGEGGICPGELLISTFKVREDNGTIRHHAGKTSTSFTATRQQGYGWNATKHNSAPGHTRSTNSISVSSEHQMTTVIAVSSSLGPTDGYLVFDVVSWRKKYYVITHNEGRSQVAITAISDMTSVSVRLPPGCVLVVDDVQITAPEYVNVTLDQFEVLLLEGDTDLTGAFVQADKRVSVVSGNRFIGEGSYLVEQTLPIRSWGKSFVSVLNPNSHWSRIDTYKIISVFSETKILVGNSSYNIDVSGEWIVVNIGILVEIVSDKPVMVMKFSNSNISGTPTCMTHVVPEEQWETKYSFITPVNFNRHWVTIVTHTDQIQAITMDTQPVQFDFQWSSVPGSNISVGVREISEGSYIVGGTGSCAVYLSGLGNVTASYCYPAGMGSKSINTNWTYLAPKVNEVQCMQEASSYAQEQTSSMTFKVHPTMDLGLLSTQASSSTELIIHTTPTSQLVSSQDLSLLTSPAAPDVSTSSEIASFDRAVVEKTHSDQHSSFPVEGCVSIKSLITNLTQDQRKDMIDHLRLHLLLNQKDLSTYKRRHTSAPDSRVSARALGTSGIVLLICALCILIVIDLPVLCHDVINLAPSKRIRLRKTV